MIKNYLTIFFLVLILPVFLFAGNNTIIGKSDGSVEPFNYDEVLPVQKLKLVDKPFVRGIHQLPLGTEGLIDTVYQRDWWPAPSNSRFGWQGQDVMIQWFKAPADMILKSAGFNECNSTEPNLATQVEVKIVSINWTEAELIAATTGAAKHLGYYDAPGNGYNDAEPLIDDFDGLNVWSNWHVLDSTTAMSEPFGTDIWSDGGSGAPVAVDPANASGDPAVMDFHWVDMSLLGFEPTFLKDEVFAIAIINSNATVDDYFVRTWANNQAGVPWGAFKYYANGRNTPGEDFGWWARLFSWDFAYVADVTGDLPPAIANVSPVPTTLETTPQTVTADVTDTNPGGTAGVASAYLYWSTDGMANWDSTAMANTTGDEYTADMPGQVAGTVIDWYINATDNNGNKTASGIRQYRIYQASGAPTLLVFNGFTAESGYPQSYYFGIGDTVGYSTFGFVHDSWAFGALTADLVNNYTSIIEITTAGPAVINNTVIRTWIEASADHHYMVCGDEWLGAQTGWPTTPVQHFAGEFVYDILGIEWEYNDIVNASTDISLVLPVDGSLLGDSLHYHASVNVGDDSMLYDPNFEITQVNWLDGVGFLGDVEVDIEGVSLSAGYPDSVFAIGGHRTLPAGNKIAFLSYDPLSLNSAPTYYWYGFSSAAPQVQFLRWIGFLAPNSLENPDEILPGKFDLAQNYPNPFNPATTIEYSVATNGKVELVIYNIQGQKVSTLVSGNKTAGSYKTTFDASNFASGVYFYKLTAGSEVVTKKMLVVK